MYANIFGIIYIDSTRTGSSRPGQTPAGGSWYPLQPQQIPSAVAGTENGSGGKWHASNPVPAQNPSTVVPIVAGRPPWKPVTGANGKSVLFVYCRSFSGACVLCAEYFCTSRCRFDSHRGSNKTKYLHLLRTALLQ